MMQTAQLRKVGSTSDNIAQGTIQNQQRDSCALILAALIRALTIPAYLLFLVCLIL